MPMSAVPIGSRSHRRRFERSNTICRMQRGVRHGVQNAVSGTRCPELPRRRRNAFHAEHGAQVAQTALRASALVVACVTTGRTRQDRALAYRRLRGQDPQRAGPRQATPDSLNCPVKA